MGIAINGLPAVYRTCAKPADANKNGEIDGNPESVSFMKCAVADKGAEQFLINMLNAPKGNVQVVPPSDVDGIFGEEEPPTAPTQAEGYVNSVTTIVGVGSVTPVNSLAPSAGWNKGTGVSADGNKVTISGGSTVDADSLEIGSFSTNGAKTLVIKVVSIKGNFPWGGKAIGFFPSKDGMQAYEYAQNPANFPAPKGVKVTDGFIDRALKAGDIFSYDVSGMTTVNLGAKAFAGPGTSATYSIWLK